MEVLASQQQLERAALDLFAEAVDLEPSERSSWLDTACHGDAALHAKVMALLAADTAEESSIFAFTHLNGDTSSHSPFDATLVPPRQIGPYGLEELIGAGGMGSVYRGQRNDGLFEQAVAIKFIRPIRGIEQVEPLIDAERKLLARMEHAGIARILDGGKTEQGLHYLVMEFIRGVALDKYADDHDLDTRARVALLREVCGAVAHAHQHLVLHCDIKPANILVTDEGHPKLIDFGVARIEDVVDSSRPEGFTRAYTSAQRLEGQPAAITDDVYSLGVVLVELVTGELPTEPIADSKRLNGDLAAIARKAMAPRREDRYGSVDALTSDLLAWLEHRPVAAVGNNWRYRARKLFERHPWRFAAAIGALLALVIALILIAWLYARAESARLDAEKRFADVRALANYMLFDLDSSLELTPGTTAARREMLDRSQQYLDALAQTAGSNQELQREVAVGLARLAEVQGVPGKAHVGDPKAAKSNLERAQTLLETLTRRRPAYLPWQRDLGKVRYLLALVYGGSDNDPARQLAKAREAEANLVRALNGIAGWSPTPKELGELNVLLTSARLTQADVFKQRNDHTAAAGIQAGEEKRLMALPPAVQREMEFEYQSGRPAMLLGDSLYYLDRYEEALAAYHRATARFEQGLVRTPGHSRLLQGTLIGYWSISGTLDELHRYNEALAAIEPSIRIGDRLVELDPANTEGLRSRDIVRGQRAIVLAHLGRYDEAIKLTEQYQHEKELRAAQAPEDAERVRDVAVMLRPLADFYRSKGDKGGACRVLHQGLQVWSDFDRRWKISEMDRRNELQVIQALLKQCP